MKTMLKKLAGTAVVAITLIAGAGVLSSPMQVEASSKVIVVKKADTETAKKVDKQLKTRRAFTLKVKGDAKTSKKLLSSLQKKVADVNGYDVLFSCKASNTAPFAIEQREFKGKRSGNYYKYEFSSDNSKLYYYSIQYFKEGWKVYKNAANKYFNDSREVYAHKFYKDYANYRDTYYKCEKEQESLSKTIAKYDKLIADIKYEAEENRTYYEKETQQKIAELKEKREPYANKYNELSATKKTCRDEIKKIVVDVTGLDEWTAEYRYMTLLFDDVKKCREDRFKQFEDNYIAMKEVVDIINKSDFSDFSQAMQIVIADLGHDCSAGYDNSTVYLKEDTTFSNSQCKSIFKKMEGIRTQLNKIGTNKLSTKEGIYNSIPCLMARQIGVKRANINLNSTRDQVFSYKVKLQSGKMATRCYTKFWGDGMTKLSDWKAYKGGVGCYSMDGQDFDTGISNLSSIY